MPLSEVARGIPVGLSNLRPDRKLVQMAKNLPAKKLREFIDQKVVPGRLLSRLKAHGWAPYHKAHPNVDLYVSDTGLPSHSDMGPTVVWVILAPPSDARRNRLELVVRGNEIPLVTGGVIVFNASFPHCVVTTSTKRWAVLAFDVVRLRHRK